MRNTKPPNLPLDEWNYRRDERIAILCGDSAPTPAQIAIADREADEAIEALLRVATYHRTQKSLF